MKKVFIIKRLMRDGKKQALRTCETEREAIAELEKIFTTTEKFYICEEIAM